MQWVGSRSYGATLVAAAAVLWSTGGLFVRALDIDLWTMLAWRSLFAALALAVVVVARQRGETLAALRRMAHGEHRQVRLRGGDTVVFSATPIPGNERAINDTIDRLFKIGCDVVTASPPTVVRCISRLCASVS